MGFKEFHKFLVENSGKSFFTLSRKAKFAIRLDGDYLHFTPESTGLERNSRITTVSNVYDQHRDSGSYTTSRYTNLTVNSSYILSLIHAFYFGSSEKEYYQDISNDRAIEGYQLDTRILKNHRDQTLAKKAKSRDNHQCRACGFRKKIKGKFVIDCHHLHPLSNSGEVLTDINDLVCLCPNCHRIAHLRQPPFDIEEIKELIHA